MKKINFFNFLVNNVITAATVIDTNITQYLPLQVGNIWVYYSSEHSLFEQCQAHEKYVITGTQVINGKLYFITQRSVIEYSGNTNQCSPSFSIRSRLFLQGTIRMDSSTYVIYDGNDCVIDSLAAKKGDSNNICISYLNPVHCDDTSYYNIFGMNYPSKDFYYTNSAGETGEGMTYAKDLGLIRYGYVQQGPTVIQFLLLGCVINGHVYGDTSFTLVGIQKVNNIIPNNFSLTQNYPNPFNPSTKIRFSIPANEGNGRDHSVRLIVYDALGKEISALVNEQLKPGEYESDFDGTNLPSGVYFYKLVVGDNTNNGSFVETKKMVLIK